MKGTNNTGFNTIGNPKIIGSLIPKQAGNKVNLQNERRKNERYK